MELSTELTNDAYEQAALYELGTPISVYPMSIDSKGRKNLQTHFRLVSFFLWLIITAFCLGVFILDYFLTQPVKPFFLSDDLWSFWFFPLLPIIAGVIMVWLLRITVLWNLLCTKGILILRNNRLEAITWEQITAFRLLKRMLAGDKEEPTYKIALSNGPSFRLPVERGREIEESYIKAYAPTLLTQYEKGSSITLSKLCITTSGINWQGKTLP